MEPDENDDSTNGIDDILTDDDLSMSELIDEWRDENNAHNWEGESGVERFGELCTAIGYKADGFRNGTVIERFLQDNPGAVELLEEFIAKHGDDLDWRDNLISTLPER